MGNVPGPLNQGLGDIIANQQQLVSNFRSELMKVYQTFISDQKLTDEALNALSESLLRVPADKLVPIELNRFPTPEKLYLWVIANSNIVFPYMSLKTAVEHMKHSVYVPRSWGITQDGKFRLPKLESTLEDSNAWVLIREIIMANWPDDLAEDADVTNSTPDLLNDDLAKNPAIEQVLVRVLELIRSPNSATLRNSDGKAETLVKNAVDFVILDELYQQDSDLKNLTISGYATSVGRRATKVETKSGNKLNYTTVYLGYKLADIIGQYIPVKTSKSPEGEPLFRIIHEMLRRISALGKKNIPKAFFEPPSIQLRNRIREGPQVKTKKGLKHNLYVPLSFVKSSECTLFPESTKKELVEVSSKIVRNLDHINKLPVKLAGEKLPLFDEYLKHSYAISDNCRSEWRKNAYVPSPDQIEDLMVRKFDHLESVDFVSEDFRTYLTMLKVKARQLTFTPVYDEPEKQQRLKAEVSQAIESKKTSRAKAR